MREGSKWVSGMKGEEVSEKGEDMREGQEVSEGGGGSK